MARHWVLSAWGKRVNRLKNEDMKTIELGQGFTAEVKDELTVRDVNSIQSVVSECSEMRAVKDASGNEIGFKSVLTGDFSQKWQDRLISAAVVSFSKDGSKLEGKPSEVLLDLPSSCLKPLNAVLESMLPKKDDPK